MEMEFDRIEKYCKGELSHDERLEFEVMLASDPSLAEEVQAYEQVTLALRKGSKQRLKHKLDDIGATLFKENARNSTWSPYLKYSIAAGLLLLILAGYYLYDVFQAELTPEELYTTYFEKMDTRIVTTRGDNTDATTASWESGLEAYRKDNFEAALKDFNSVLSDQSFPMKSAAHLFSGISRLMMNAPDQALTHFQQVAPESAFAQEARWYEGLSYLKLHNMNKAKLVFEEIAGNPAHYKKVEASSIAAELKKSTPDESL